LPMGPARILVVEDDRTIGDGLLRSLTSQGYHATLVTAGHEAITSAEAEQPDLVLLDLGLPDLDGVEVCRRLRSRLPGVAILVLTARAEELDVVVGLDAGADDYLTKPFRLAELLARIRAQLRRTPSADAVEPLAVGDLQLDPGARRAWLAGDELELRPKEFDLLALLMRQAGQAVSREQIMAEVWDPHWFGSTKTLDIHMAALRRKLLPAARAPEITTLRGVGYRLEAP
jgi:DNA-binding response OmpR family regulator